MASSKTYSAPKSSTQSNSNMSCEKSAPFNNWPNDIGFESNWEQKSEIELNVEGVIPTYVAGTLYRTGPGARKVVTSKGTTYTASHWFDGLSMVHRFVVSATDDPNKPVKVRYNSRGVVDAFVEKIRETGRLKDFSFAQNKDPCRSYFKKLMSVFTPEPTTIEGNLGGTQNIGVTMSVNLPGLRDPGATKHSDTSSTTNGIYSLHLKSDMPAFQRIDPETLEPLGLTNQNTGDVFNYNLEMGRTNFYRIFKVSGSTGETSILATFPGTPAYIHSLFLTQDYVVFCVWSSHFVAGGMSILWNRNILDSIAPFSKKKTAKWYVVDRKHGKGLIATYESPAFFAFHTVNAWQEPSPSNSQNTDILAEVCTYENLDVLHKHYYENLLSTSAAGAAYRVDHFSSTQRTLQRFRLPSIPSDPLPAKSPPLQATIECSAPRKISPELPTINPYYTTRAHRYTYGVLDRGLSSFVDGLVKFDSVSRSETIWEEHGHSPGEPIFVANPQGKGEDDGVLLSVVLDGERGRSYMLVLDARTMEEVGRAVVEGGVVGFGFHGVHVPDGRGTVCEV